jgi:ferredoxin, 2Fe-2S
MPIISFLKDRKPIEVTEGAELMKSLLEASLPVASSCHGDGICGRCKIQIVKGMENLSPINTTEEILRTRLRIPKDFRVSCQTRVMGDIVIDATYW